MKSKPLVSPAGSYLITWITFLLGAIWWSGEKAVRGEVLTDAEKARKVFEMYEHYKQSAFPNEEDITPEEALSLLQQGKTVFVDVRSHEEQAVSMLPGAIAKETFLKDPQAYQGHVIIAYCTISYRSGLFVARYPKSPVRLLNLRGGLLGWLHAGGKVYKHESETTRVHVYGKKWDLAPHQYVTTWFKIPFLQW